MVVVVVVFVVVVIFVPASYVKSSGGYTAIHFPVVQASRVSLGGRIGGAESERVSERDGEFLQVVLGGVGVWRLYAIISQWISRR